MAVCRSCYSAEDIPYSYEQVGTESFEMTALFKCIYLKVH